jgi:hypothetical protein
MIPLIWKTESSAAFHGAICQELYFLEETANPTDASDYGIGGYLYRTYSTIVTSS